MKAAEGRKTSFKQQHVQQKHAKTSKTTAVTIEHGRRHGAQLKKQSDPVGT